MCVLAVAATHTTAHARTHPRARAQFVGAEQPQQLTIQDGKHPMLDAALDGGAVPNSLALSADKLRAAVITGWVSQVGGLRCHPATAQPSMLWVWCHAHTWCAPCVRVC